MPAAQARAIQAGFRFSSTWRSPFESLRSVVVEAHAGEVAMILGALEIFITRGEAHAVAGAAQSLDADAELVAVEDVHVADGRDRFEVVEVRAHAAFDLIAVAVLIVVNALEVLAV